MLDISVKQIQNDHDWAEAKRIRVEVFVDEQGVPEEDELDEFEEVSRHFIARYKGEPAGACRWRYTDHGVKLERFAVDKKYRGKGIGRALVQATLDDIEADKNAKGKVRYLNAQISALFLYERFSFVKEGEPFDECGIMHYRMSQKVL